MSETMKVGSLRELDALTATTIFALQPAELADDPPCPECGGEMRYCGGRSWCSPCGEWRYGPCREYSDDILAAWSVVERMREGGAAMTMSCDSVLAAEPILWRVIFEGQIPRKGIAMAATAPLAIVLGALRAKGLKVEYPSLPSPTDTGDGG